MKQNISSLNSLVTLRLLKDYDLPLTFSWRNKPEIKKQFFTEVNDYAKHLEWFEKYKDREDDYTFIIEDTASGTAVGQVALYNIRKALLSAEYGRLMLGNNDYKGRGYAKAATKLILDIGFLNFGLESIYLEVATGNDTAYNLYLNCGFRELWKSAFCIDMKITKEEYSNKEV